MTLSIIIVSYNVKRLLGECLRSVALAIGGLDTEIIVVDNNSTDGSLEALRPLFPGVTFLASRENTGFARANNLALTQASGQFVLFLNPDTVLPAGSLKACVDFMHAHPDAGAMGVKMVDGEGEYLPESKRGFPSPMVAFWKLSGMAGIFPRSRYFARYYHGDLNSDQTHRVEVLSGAFFLARKKVLDKTGGFDERFFMYAEDIDLSYRITQAGYNNYYFPGVTITHYKGSSTKKDSKYVRMFYRAMSQFVEKHYGRGLFTAFLEAGIRLRAGWEIIRNHTKKH